MSVKASVIYPNKPGSKFDLDYYLKTHMPLVEKQWTQYGLKSWEIIQYDAGLQGSSPDYNIHAILEWDRSESISTATTSEEAKIVFGDIPNFTDTQPIFLAGKSVGKN